MTHASTTPPRIDIFLSYARQDAARASDLAHALEHCGWSVFWDRRIATGEDWRDNIGNALGRARCVVVLWSHQSIKSNWVIQEAEDGLQRGVLVPVLFDSVPQPLGFRQLQAADLTDWKGSEGSAQFDELVAEIRRRLVESAVSVGDELLHESRPNRENSRQARSDHATFKPIAVAVAILVTVAIGAAYEYPQTWTYLQTGQTISGVVTRSGPGAVVDALSGTVDGNLIRVRMVAIDGTYEGNVTGTVSADDRSIEARFTDSLKHKDGRCTATRKSAT